MPTPGKAVAFYTGKRGVLPSGKAGVYNVLGSCPICCPPHWLGWVFTDIGFKKGGQDGAFRQYYNTNEVPASPWTVSASSSLISLRLDFETDVTCGGDNQYAQEATARFFFYVLQPKQVTISWDGKAECHDEQFDFLNFVFAAFELNAHAPGGQQGCVMGPPVFDQTQPAVFNIPAGYHDLWMHCWTGDEYYHDGAFYAVTVQLDDIP